MSAVVVGPPGVEVEYPEGPKVPEGDLQVRRWAELHFALRHWPAERPGGDAAWACSDINVYYKQGDPTVVVSPDVAVAFGVDGAALDGQSTYRVWDASAPPPGLSSRPPAAARARSGRQRRSSSSKVAHARRTTPPCRCGPESGRSAGREAAEGVDRPPNRRIAQGRSHFDPADPLESGSHRTGSIPPWMVQPPSRIQTLSRFNSLRRAE